MIQINRNSQHTEQILEECDALRKNSSQLDHDRLRKAINWDEEQRKTDDKLEPHNLQEEYLPTIHITQQLGNTLISILRIHI
jgi:hypothetical protein